MPEAYVIANIDVENPEAYQDYVAQVPATVARYGGEFVVRGGRWESLEGQEPLPRLVIIKFPSFEAAQSWYRSEEYAPLAKIRQAASTGNVILVEGAA